MKAVFEKINVKDIHPVEYNPRKISRTELNRLIKNIEEFGLVDPIVINLRNNHIIGGHQRYFALTEKYGADLCLDLVRLGDVGWVFFNQNLTVQDELYEKALNVSLNKLSGEWDYEKLSKLLLDLEESELDNDLSGFKPSEFELYDEDITFDHEIFTRNNNSSYTIPTIECPSCGHEFYDE